MASVFENSDAAADGSELELADKSQPDAAEQTELERGRVWRRGNVAPNTDKQNAGPVLRTTVKPVKRFRPDSNNDKTNPSPSRKKRLKTSSTTANKPYEGVAAVQAEAKISQTADFSCLPTIVSPNEKEYTPVDADKNEERGNKDTAPVKKKRVWEQWTVEDKNYFFEAVAMYGKDFEAIRTAIAQKHRKKGENCVAKTKDQVRHLYYRTWTMISKIIDTDAYPLNINKAFQELYAVINYGELRKKLGGNLKKKGIEKLNELIKGGTTSTRYKGKNFRIKTPSCRALKKMNPEYQSKEGIYDLPLVSDTRRMKIPLYVTIELCPLTMAAWNQVHSIAHNPRIRIRLSVECQISSIFSFLDKKWKPLTGRLICFANQGQYKTHSPLQNTSKNSTSLWDGTLVIQTPPDASVNTRIMVFQVANNKMHCVVSYALRKSVQSAEKTSEGLHKETSAELEEKQTASTETEDATSILNSKAENGCLSESEAMDTCLSSEEDYDYDSANEDAFKEGNNYEQPDKSKNLPKKFTEISTDNNTEIQTLDTTFMLKDKEITPDGSPKTPISTFMPSDSQTKCPSRDEMRCIATDVTKANLTSKSIDESYPTSFIAHHQLSHPTLAISNASHDSPSVDEDIDSEAEKPQDEIDINSQTEETLSHEGSSCPEVQESKPVKDTDSPTARYNSATSINNSAADKTKDDKNKMGKKLLVSAKLFGDSTKGKRRKNVSKNKPFIKTVQRWNAKDCGKATIAEVYMMLGKPSVFRLCYHWLQNAAENSEAMRSDSCDQSQVETGNGNKPLSLSTRLIALIQAAKLSQKDKEHKQKSDNEEILAQRKPKSPAVKTKSSAIQCDIIKFNHKGDERNRSHTTSTSLASSNPHGRGISKIMPVETVIVDNLPISVSGFAVPAVPVDRQTRLTANPSKPVQGTKVSAETMNWLLHHERSRSSRLLRRPIVVDRSPAQRASRRPMKTFSIITRGPNKIGFLPSYPVLAPRAIAPKPRAMTNCPETQMQSTLDINQLLLDTTASPPNSGLTQLMTGNLLAQAAKEAGVAPPTPIKNPQALLTSKEDTNNTNFNGTIESFTAEVLQNATYAIGDVVPHSVAPILNIRSLPPIQQQLLERRRNMTAEAKDVSDVALTLNTRIEQDEPLIDVLSPDVSLPPTNPMVCLMTSSGSSPSSSTLSSSLTVNPTIVYSLPELSWPGHDIPPSAFPIMGETLIDKLVDGEADMVLSSLNSNSPEKDNEKANGGRLLIIPSSLLEENSLSRLSFDMQMTPVKSSEVPVHPWTINTNSRDSMGLSSLLNTPQKILPSDVEDSLDDLVPKEKTGDKASITYRPVAAELSFFPGTENCSSSSVTDCKSRPLDQNSSNFLSGADTEVELQLQSLMYDNSVDLVSKFQDLVRHTTECDELTALASDENARDGHVAIENSFQSSHAICNSKT